jgi:hypothetical protein
MNRHKLVSTSIEEQVWGQKLSLYLNANRFEELLSKVNMSFSDNLTPWAEQNSDNFPGIFRQSWILSVSSFFPFPLSFNVSVKKTVTLTKINR